MNKEIEEIIRKNLPQEVGETLKKVLEEGDVAKENLKLLQEDYEHVRDARDKYKSKLKDHVDLDIRENNLNNKESELKEKERNLEITELKIRLDEANKRSIEISGFVSSLVRNTQFRESVFGSTSKSTLDQYGNSIMTSDPYNHTKTITEE